MFLTLLILKSSSTNIVPFDDKNLINQLKKGKKISEIMDLEQIKNYFPEVEKFAQLIESFELPETSCYASVVKKMNINCDKLDDKNRSSLALKFTQCYFNLTNRTKDYPFDYPEEEQLKKMINETYEIYVTLKIHTSNLCHFARQNIFNEVTSESLINLFKSVVDSSNSIHELSGEYNESTISLKKSVEKIRGQLQNGTYALSILNSLMESFQGNLTSITSVIDIGINQMERIKFYGIVLISTFIIAFFLPEILIPVIIITIILFSIDKGISIKYSNWDSSLIRKIMKTLYLTLCSMYPIYQAINYLYIVGITILSFFNVKQNLNSNIPRFTVKKFQSQKFQRIKPF